MADHPVLHCSTPTPGDGETRLISTAVANEGEGAITLTDVAHVQNQIAISISCAAPPVDKMPDMADCRDQSVSHLGFSMDAKDEGEGSQNRMKRTRYYTLW